MGEFRILPLFPIKSLIIIERSEASYKISPRSGRLQGVNKVGDWGRKIGGESKLPLSSPKSEVINFILFKK